MTKSEVVKDGWFYIGTYLQGEYGDAHRPVEQRSPICTLLVRHCELRRMPKGDLRTRVKRDALEFCDEDAMTAWIEEHGAKELPDEADGVPLYVPEEFCPDGLAVAAEFAQ